MVFCLLKDLNGLVSELCIEQKSQKMCLFMVYPKISNLFFSVSLLKKIIVLLIFPSPHVYNFY